MFPDMPFEVATACLEPGALLALFTDGIPEARRGSVDEFFDDDWEMAALNGLQHRATLEEIASGLLEEVNCFLAGEPRSDDITLTLIRRDGAATTVAL